MRRDNGGDKEEDESTVVPSQKDTLHEHIELIPPDVFEVIVEHTKEITNFLDAIVVPTIAKSDLTQERKEQLLGGSLNEALLIFAEVVIDRWGMDQKVHFADLDSLLKNYKHFQDTFDVRVY